MTLHVSKQSRSSLFVVSTIVVTDIYVHSLVELKIIYMLSYLSFKLRILVLDDRL